MKQQIISHGIAVLLSIVIGLLLYPVLFGDTEPLEVQVAPDSTSLSGEPDSIWIVHDTTYIPEYDTTYVDTGSTKTQTIIDTEYVVIKEKYIRSFKEFRHSSYVLSQIWIDSPRKVFNIDNSVVVDWQLHYNDTYKPKIEAELSRESRNNLLKGIVAGGLVTAGLMSGDWRIAAGAAAAGGGIIIIF